MVVVQPGRNNEFRRITGVLATLVLFKVSPSSSGGTCLPPTGEAGIARESLCRMDVQQASAITGPRCSTLARERGEPLAGTAAAASTWLCIEQPGPWGRDALLESHLDVDVGRELAERVRDTGVRVVLIRRPGRHPDRHRPVPRRLYLAHTAPGRTWLERASVTDPRELFDLDVAALGAGVPSGLGERVSTPLLLICTNGRRDVCCALLGRPIAEAAPAHDEQVWECAHLGGHRFAPTGLELPTGYAYGRLTLADTERLLTPASGVLVNKCRGRSTWSGPGQVAELAVRAAVRDHDPDALRIADVEPAGVGRWQVIVAHADRRRWHVAVVERVSADLRSASCGADPTPSTVLEAEVVHDLVTT